MIDDLAKQLLNDINQFMESGKAAAESAFPREQLKGVIESTLKRMDLVTREEFDAQQAVLLRTRELLESLQQQVEVLEELAAKPKP